MRVVLWAKIITNLSDEASRSKKAREFFHSDVCGPMSVNSLSGTKYYVFFIDDFSGYQFVFCIKNKTKVIKCFKKVKGESVSDTKFHVEILE